MSSRPRRSAAITALEKIKEIAKEAEKYDDYGDVIEETDACIRIPSISESIKTTLEKSTAPTAKASEPMKDTTEPVKTEPVKTEPVKTTPDTLFGISSSSDNLKYNAYQMHINDFKMKHIENIKTYLILAENSDMKYIAIPELIKYLITNPSMIIHHSNFGKQVANKMIEFENVLQTAKKIGNHTITETYRKELISLIKILKKTTSMHSKLNTMANKEFYDNIETIANDF
jgi:hypothetical protein